MPTELETIGQQIRKDLLSFNIAPPVELVNRGYVNTGNLVGTNSINPPEPSLVDFPYIPGTGSSSSRGSRQDVSELRKEIVNKNTYIGEYVQYGISLTESPNRNPNNKQENYLDRYSKTFNSQQSGLEVIAGILGVGSSIGGLGLNSSGSNLSNSFNLKNSLAGKTLGINQGDETPLGIIGANQLRKAIADNTSNNILNLTVDKIDPLNPDGNYIRGDYRITNSYDFFGTVDTILGSTNPNPDPNGTFFSDPTNLPHSYNINTFVNPGSTTVERNAELLNKSGKAIVDTVSKLTNSNRYSIENTYMGSVDNSEFFTFNTITNENVSTIDYFYDGSRIFDTNNPRYKRFGMFNKVFPVSVNLASKVDNNNLSVAYDDKSINSSVTDQSFTIINDGHSIKDNETWVNNGQGENPFEEGSMLYRTYELYRSNINKNLVTDRYGSVDDNTPGSVKLASGDNVLSKGNAILNEDETDFCRVWTVANQYDRICRAKRNGNEYKYHISTGKGLISGNQSVLMDNNMPQIVPYNDEIRRNKNNYMLSIENLAWRNDYSTLPEYEQGPGDPENPSVKGRIMWFPPYGLSISENVSVNWNEESFIGRGEPSFTYSNTKRSGNLKFKVVVDTVSCLKNILNKAIDDKASGKQDLIAKFFDGCYMPENGTCGYDFDSLPNPTKLQRKEFINNINGIKTKIVGVPVPEITNDESEPITINLDESVLYFPNQNTTLNYSNKELINYRLNSSRIAGSANTEQVNGAVQNTQSRNYLNNDSANVNFFNEFLYDVINNGDTVTLQESNNVNNSNFYNKVIDALNDIYLEKSGEGKNLVFKNIELIYKAKGDASIDNSTEDQDINRDIRNRELANRRADNTLNIVSDLSGNLVNNLLTAVNEIFIIDVNSNQTYLPGLFKVTTKTEEVDETNNRRKRNDNSLDNYTYNIRNYFKNIGNNNIEYNLSDYADESEYIDRITEEFRFINGIKNLNSEDEIVLKDITKSALRGSEINTDEGISEELLSFIGRELPSQENDRKATLDFSIKVTYEIVNEDDFTISNGNNIAPDINPDGTTPIVNNDGNITDENNTVLRNDIKESVYFEYLQQCEPAVFGSLTEKIPYFHPTFHSTTAEGLNSRLTFLHQCTRQGSPTVNVSTENEINGFIKKNLAFGAPPVCILRVGDFIYSKIIITQLNISYGDEMQWDLNPEGIGVQPMIADIDISFEYLGGSTLEGPINKLQTALSHNFYANTEFYDPRAEYYIDTKVETEGDEVGGRQIKGGLSEYIKKYNKTVN